jgi:hypothetical protein
MSRTYYLTILGWDLESDPLTSVSETFKFGEFEFVLEVVTQPGVTTKGISSRSTVLRRAGTATPGPSLSRSDHSVGVFLRLLNSHKLLDRELAVDFEVQILKSREGIWLAPHLLKLAANFSARRSRWGWLNFDRQIQNSVFYLLEVESPPLTQIKIFELESNLRFKVIMTKPRDSDRLGRSFRWSEGEPYSWSEVRL